MSVSDGADAVSIERKFTEYLAGFDVQDLPKEAVDGTLAVILDHVLCGDLGMEQPWVRMLRDQFRAELDGWFPEPPDSGAGDSGPRNDGRQSGIAPLYGTKEYLPARLAAMVNGTAAHGLELDDMYHPSLIHPGSCVVPAALAAAHAYGSSGRELIVAVAAGYEAIRRICAATGTRHSYEGFHSTGVIGPFGAAVAAGLLAGLDARGLRNALGITASFGAGIKAFQNGPGMVKRMHAGRAAEAGILAAELAKRGFEGPDGALAGRFGFIEVWGYTDERDAARLLPDGSEKLLVEEGVYFKPYSTCGAIHGVLMAAQAARAELGDKVVEIAALEIGSAKRIVDQNNIPVPTDPMTAQYSVQYGTALTLLGHVDDLRRFQDVTTYDDPAVRTLIDRMSVVVDEEAERAYVHSADGRLTCRLGDGSTVEFYRAATADVSSGLDAVRAKCGRLWGALRSPENQQDVVHAIVDLAQDGDPRSIHTALAAAGR